MTNETANNKRIAKNTLLLYFRMLFMMGVSLYTSRIVLSTLGVEDYGIYEVVGGVVAMFSVLSGSLSAAISRFITFELGRENNEKLKNIFSSAVTIQIGLAIIVIILAETIGLWFLNNKMVIPTDRMDAANWVFQFSIFAFAINLISIPYNATIIAHEKMSAFAYISILEILGKLAIAFLIIITPLDKLFFYSFLLAVMAVIIRLIYGIYCKRHFEECCYHFIYDYELLKQMFGFAGWNFIGSTASILRDQGGNIVINLFYGPAVNAARGIASQVNTAILAFVNNFMMALNPQITKSYASGEHDYMMKLIFLGARLSFYVLLFISLPIILNAHYFLTIWLGDIPEHTVAFVRLVLIFAMSESLANPLITAMLATGDIRNYQLIVGGLQILNLPLSYIFLRMGCIPETVLIVAIIISVCCEMLRLYMLRNMIGLVVRDFLSKVYFNVIFVSFVAAVFPYILTVYFEKDLLNVIFITFCSLLCTLLSILYVGCNREERALVINKIKQFKRKISKS